MRRWRGLTRAACNGWPGQGQGLHCVLWAWGRRCRPRARSGLSGVVSAWVRMHILGEGTRKNTEVSPTNPRLRWCATSVLVPHCFPAQRVSMPSHGRRPSAVCLPYGSPFAVWWRRRSPRSGVAKRRSAKADRYSGVRELHSVPELRGPVDAQLFFERFVATRTPVIVRGGVQSETMAVLADDAALDAAAGDCQLQVGVLAYRPRPALASASLLTVPYSLLVTHWRSRPTTHHSLRITHSRLQVEVRAGAESFGKGNRRRMRFGALLRKAAGPR